MAVAVRAVSSTAMSLSIWMPPSLNVTKSSMRCRRIQMTVKNISMMKTRWLQALIKSPSVILVWFSLNRVWMCSVLLSTYMVVAKVKVLRFGEAPQSTWTGATCSRCLVVVRKVLLVSAIITEIFPIMKPIAVMLIWKVQRQVFLRQMPTMKLCPSVSLSMVVVSWDLLPAIRLSSWATDESSTPSLVHVTLIS